MKVPKHFATLDPLTRNFPVSWKDVWFRRYAKRTGQGVVAYECPGCQNQFDHEHIDELHGDHIWPYSLFGATTWENYQLLCAKCNWKKSNFIDIELRQKLASEEFRVVIIRFLENRVAEENRNLFLRRLMASIQNTVG